MEIDLVVDETECFAYQRGKCKALTVPKCEGVGCSFFKTKAQLKDERQKALRRIESLDKYRRKDIMDTYFSSQQGKAE